MHNISQYHEEVSYAHAYIQEVQFINIVISKVM